MLPGDILFVPNNKARSVGLEDRRCGDLYYQRNLDLRAVLMTAVRESRRRKGDMKTSGSSGPPYRIEPANGSNAVRACVRREAPSPITPVYAMPESADYGTSTSRAEPAASDAAAPLAPDRVRRGSGRPGRRCDRPDQHAGVSRRHVDATGGFRRRVLSRACARFRRCSPTLRRRATSGTR